MALTLSLDQAFSKANKFIKKGEIESALYIYKSVLQKFPKNWEKEFAFLTQTGLDYIELFLENKILDDKNMRASVYMNSDPGTVFLQYILESALISIISPFFFFICCCRKIGNLIFPTKHNACLYEHLKLLQLLNFLF